MAGIDDPREISRRKLLQTSGGAIGLPFVGVRDPSDDDSGDARCPDATLEPSMDRDERSNAGDCADDHPATEELRGDVRRALEERYSNVGTLIEAGFLPYIDVGVPGDEGGYSHWLNPTFIGDDTILDPDRPEAVLVDNRWWRPIGAMFVATENGDPVDDPPAVYGDEDGNEDDGCAPWHYHAGLPGRFAWWYYRHVYEDDYRTGDLSLPCATPYMLHVWTYPNPGGVYAHAPPPPENRGGPPAEDPGFSTPAVPGEDDLGWDALPDALAHRARSRSSGGSLGSRLASIFDR